VVRDGLVLRPLSELALLDLLPVCSTAFSAMAVLLLLGHVGSADPVLVLRLALQVLHHVALHLPGDLARAAVLPDPLLARDALLQQREGEEHRRWMEVGINWFKSGNGEKRHCKMCFSDPMDTLESYVYCMHVHRYNLNII